MTIKPKNDTERVALTAAMHYANVPGTDDAWLALADGKAVDVDRDAIVQALEQLDAESHEDSDEYRKLADRISS